jgi:hypothetical protein
MVIGSANDRAETFADLPSKFFFPVLILAIRGESITDRTGMGESLSPR